MRRKYFVLFALFYIAFPSLDLNAQCTTPARVLINDVDTSSITFIIDGAQNNSLATNGICGVNIAFSHEYVGDLAIYLISPAGQEVQLLGPSVSASSITQFINWDVLFIPCALPASPDQGLFPTWDNLGNWFQFTNYSGTYYPNNGCLEDFNTGPINGNWSIRIEDGVEFGTGIIERISLIFCDDTGITCENCIADAGAFVNTVITECEGKSDLKFIPEIIFEDQEPPTDLYDYKYVILDVNGYVQIQDTVDLSNFQPATYQICGLSIQKTDLPAVQITFGMSKSEIEQSLENNNLCSDLTETCITYRVQDVQDTILISESICLGSSYDINGESYTEAGTYIVGYSGANCDSMTILNLDIINVITIINGRNQVLSCSNNRIILDASLSFSEEPFTFQWRTDNGFIRSNNPDQPVIIVSQTGAYYLDLISENCMITDTVLIVDDGTALEIDLTYDTINCINQSTLVQINTDNPTSNIRWDGPAAFSRNGDNIAVSIPGNYSVTVTDVNGCIGLDTAYVIGDLDVNIPVFNVPLITCIQEVVNPNMSLVDSNLHTFNWTGPFGFTSILQNPDISEPGFYNVEITAPNGCTDDYSLAVNDSRDIPILITNTNEITCNNPAVNISVISTVNNVTYSWSGPNGFTSDIQTPSVSAPGDYFVTVTSDVQCEASTMLTVTEDITPPEVTASDIVIRCGDGGVTNLGITTNAVMPTFRWSGPNGYVAFGPNPTAVIIGNYRVTVTRANGCESSRNFSLVPGPNVPNVTFFSDTVDCDQPLVPILPSDTLSYNYVYTGPGNQFYNEATPDVSELGIYSIRVTDGAGCFSNYVHQVYVDTIIPTITLNSEEIDCDSDSVTLNFDSDIRIRSGLWEGPTLFSIDIDNPFVDTPGVFFFTGTAYNGCIDRDSINVRENFDLPILTPRDNYFSCFEDSISLIVDTSFPLNASSWTGPNGYISSDLQPTVTTDGVYTLTATGNNGCINTTNVIVRYDTLPAQVSLTLDSILTCPDPISTITADINETGVTTTWSGPGGTTNGGNFLDVNVSGIWNISIVDSTGCITVDSIAVGTDIIYPEFTTDYITIDCTNPQSQVDISIIGNLDSITWSGPLSIQNDTRSFMTDQDGLYSYTAHAVNGCDSTISFTIEIDTIKPIFTLEVSDTIDCNNPNVVLSAITQDSIVEYQWYNINGLFSSDSTPSISESDTYRLRGILDNGCFTEVSIFAELDTIKPLVQGIGDTVTCRNGRGTLDLITNIDKPIFNWINNNGFQSSSQSPLVVDPGIYTINVIAPNGCVGSSEVELFEDRTPPRIFMEELSYLLCDSSGINLSVTSDIVGTTFSWFGPNNYFSSEQRPFVNDEGTYFMFARGTNGCLAEDSTAVIIDTRMPEFELAAEIITCVNPSAEVSVIFAENTNTWNWTGPNGFNTINESFDVTEPGLFMISVIGSNLCQDTASIEVLRDDDIPIALATSDESIQCETRRIRLDGSSSTGAHNLMYIWTTQNGIFVNGENSSRPLIEEVGDYQLKVVDVINGCEDSTVLSIIETSQEFLSFEVTSMDPTCEGFQNGFINIDNYNGGTGPYLISVNSQTFASRNNIPFLDAGNYVLTVKDSLGCQVSQEVIINPPREVNLTLYRDTIIRLGDSVEIQGAINLFPSQIAVYEWSPLEGLECNDCLVQTVRPQVNTVYKLRLTDDRGCVVEGEILIRVEQLPDLRIPNIFFPGSNNGNDIFYIPQSDGIEIVNYLSVYDRWGNRLFHSENFLPGDKNIGWNGEFQGQRLEPSVFAVIGEVTLVNGQKVLIESDLTLIR